MTQQQKQDDKMVVCSGCVRQTANLKGWMDDNAIVLDILPPLWAGQGSSLQILLVCFERSQGVSFLECFVYLLNALCDLLRSKGLSFLVRFEL